MNDYSVHNSIRNNSCSNEKQIIDYETDQSVRAKKKLQFSFLSESSFGFEEVSEINENDMTLGLPLSQDDEDSLSQHSSVDMFEETILERTLCENTLSLEKADYFIPVALPPSRSEVAASLATLDIPETINPTPYFSNYQDVKRKKEVGGTVLHLCSRNIVDLEEFQSNVISRGINEQQKTLFKLVLDTKNAKANRANIASSLVSDRAVHITPVKLPPSVKEVKVWSRARAILQQEKRNPVKPKTVTKVSAPMSPGVGLSQESDDMLNISQCSSLEITTPESVKSTQHSTPQSESNRSSGVELQPPRRTPILRRPSKPRRNTRRLSVEPTLASIKEDSDGSLAPSSLLTARNNVATSERSQRSKKVSALPDSQDSSLRRLLLSSQFKNQVSPLSTNMSDISCLQIEGLNRSKDFRVPLENLQHVRNTSEHQFTTLLILELHICVCGELKPDPERDPIRAVFYTVVNDVPEDSSLPRLLTGVIAVDSPNPSTHLLSRIGLQVNVTYSADEVSLLKQVIEFVHEWDPDIVAGYEIEMLSWGYLIDRANTLGVNLKSELSRVVTDENSKQKRKEGVDSEGDGAFHGGLNLIGRVVIDVWRLMRNEVALQSYSFENIAYHILHQRLPLHSLASLSFWWEHSSHLYRWRTVQHYLNRVTGIARILDQLDFIGRTSELARLFGIQFFEVLSRGSQFRVESMMLRLAKPLNFVAISPSVQQRARMRAPEMLPLIMEPESRFYSDPVIVLDFQSLYPSMIIAYNYCFSTCLGRVEHLGKCSHYEFGCCHLYVPPGRLKKLTVSPCGVAFVKPEVRRGVLPQMLEEILEARLAVKDSMKRHRDDRTLQRVLHARQLGLKLIANVTYGYTSANFSGRMPCIEVGDSVVSKGRETLERAITTVQSNENWRARVVYGDTDSLFVLVPGRSREEAFRIGAEIAEAVTQQNPSPVKLKLEKVYQPCILQTKKRYVGYMYESPNQKEPVYDAKGIETVRRDGCPAVAKMLEKTLRILFETADVSLVKSYVCRQFTKMFKGRTNLQDFIYAKEYRGMANYRPGACVPALELTRRWLAKDRRSEPRITERVPYVIVNGPPGLPLIHLVRSPRDVVADPGLRLNVVYYITRAIIPPLERCLALIGADVLSWYTDLPRKKAYVYTAEGQNNARKNTISQYFCTVECVCCGQLTNKGICVDCRKRPQHVALQLSEKLHSWEHSYNTITKVCQSCIGSTGDVNCVSLDCPILYRRLQTSREYEHSNIIRRLKDEF